MASPTTIAAAAVNVSASTATLLDATNSANRQMVEVCNNGTQPITVVETSSGAPTITAGVGKIVQPKSCEWFWSGQGARLYALVGPVAPGDTAVTQSSPNNTWVVEKV